MNLIWHSECARTILRLTLLFHCSSVKRDQCYPIKQTGKLRLGTLHFWNTKLGTGREREESVSAQALDLALTLPLLPAA